MAVDDPPPINHPIVVWNACVLWFISLFILTISLLLFACADDILACTGTDVINDILLLSGIVMLPTSLHMVCSIARSKRISHKAKVGIFPLWFCVLSIIMINIAGLFFCIRRIWIGEKLIQVRILQSMAKYRTGKKHQRFIDNLQWSLKCCGLNSYKDWFTRDWYDKSRDYEWESSPHKHLKNLVLTDSVPLSCCRSGACISNYLSELGTKSIHTEGCNAYLNRLIMIYVLVHITIFVMVTFMEILVLSYIVKGNKCEEDPRQRIEDYNVKHIMSAKENFRPSSGSYVVGPSDESDEESSV